MPLNVRWSAQELAHAVGDSETSVLVFDAEFRDTVAALVASLEQTPLSTLPEHTHKPFALVELFAYSGASSERLSGVVLYQHCDLVRGGKAKARLSHDDHGAYEHHGAHAHSPAAADEVPL